MNKSLENNLRIMAIPALSILVVVVIFLLAGNFVVAKITSLIAENEAAQKSKAMLQDKLSSLQTTQAQVANSAQSLTMALPSANTSLAISSQLRVIGAENSLGLENFSVGTEIKEGAISHVDVTFDANGPSANILNFIEQTKTIAPLNKVKRLKLTTASGEVSRANIVVSSYWAAFPTKIPAVSDPLQQITPEEQTLLTTLSTLRSPQFLELSPESGGGKADPFSSL